MTGKLFAWILIVYLAGNYYGIHADTQVVASGYGAQTRPADKSDLPSLRGECDVRNPISCDSSLLEICSFRNGSYVCECPPNHSRLPDGRCLVANECFEKRMNDCSDDAKCTDTLESYTCQCKDGFTDLSTDKQKPGRICKKECNECAEPAKYNVDCHANAQCQDTPEHYTCACNPGYVDVSERYSLQAGRRCNKDVDPCSSASLNDCSSNGTCTSSKTAYTCQCKPGYNDVSPDKNYPGRDCRLPEKENPSPNSKCDPKKNSCPSGETCSEYHGDYCCQCPGGSVRSTTSNTCINTNLCSSQTDCDPNANCINRPGTYDCECKAGYSDLSSDASKRGRKCVLPENKCSSKDKNDCSSFATCLPTITGYECQCNSGYLDVSSCSGKQRGRVCIEEKDECKDPHLNSCSENADCVKKPDGYACLCQAGFIDLSSSANLQPGRVCVLQTNCPAHVTDLIFLVDGSGSIGTSDFKSQVLPFLSEFANLFKIGPDQTRVGVIQFSDQIRKEFDLNQYSTSSTLQQAINNIQYLAGLTHTGEAIDYMMKEGFDSAHGGRPNTAEVHQVAIVITDGRAQDAVAEPAARARKAGVTMYAVGVTNHIQESQLEEIAGNASRVFIVGAFKDLNTKLRAVIQKELCPLSPPPPNKCPDCDPGRNYVCNDGKCVCPPGFCEDTVNKICGAQMCNPDLSFVTCPYPMECRVTPYKNYRCACPNQGLCKSDGSCGNVTKQCPNAEPSTTQAPTSPCEGCNPPCDINKNQFCQKNSEGKWYCGCKERYTLDPVTQVCSINECAVPGLNSCSQFANCTDQLNGYYCTCFTGYKDLSQGKGQICEKIVNPCDGNTHTCSKNADCIPDCFGEYTCRCKVGYVDKNPPNPGRICENRVNECLDPNLNNCSKNADCFDLEVGYRCACKTGYTDTKPYEDPGRFCFIDPCQDSSKNDCWLKRCRVTDIQAGTFTCDACPNGYVDDDPSRPGRICTARVEPCSDKKANDCDVNAYCKGISGKPFEYTCVCREGYFDVSSDITNMPGRKCDPIVNPCNDPKLNDCDTNADCRDLKNNKYNCTCRNEFRDKSPDPTKPGRVCIPIAKHCLSSHLNNCSTNANCTQLEDGYNCVCKSGFRDKSENGLTGRICVPPVDPCMKNDCDSHAKCIKAGDDTYTCQCVPPYTDSSPDPTKSPGRICKYDGCASNYTACSAYADCKNGDGVVICICKKGYRDLDPDHPGTKCANVTTCGGKACETSANMQCDNITDTCGCLPGYERKDENSTCNQITTSSVVTPTVTPPRNFCADFPECPINNGTCKNLKEEAKCICIDGYVDLRTYDWELKRRCHGDAFCLKYADVRFCCLRAHKCDLSSTCVPLPAGGYQCGCPDGTTVPEGTVCPAPPPTPGSVVRDQCAACSYNGKCIFNEATGKTTCECATWYTGDTCATDVRIILAIIFAILFLLLSLCCCLYFCLKCRCFGLGAGAGAGTYREMSMGSEGMSAYGKESDLYQNFTIPRARLKDPAAAGLAGAGGHETMTEDVTREQRSLDRYIDHTPSVERVRGDNMAISDVAPRLPVARDEEWESGSEASSGASMEEQYERRVTTDYKKTETTKTTGASGTTAEFHVYGPSRTEALTMGSSSAAGAAGLATDRSIREITTSSRYEQDVDDDEEYSEDGSSVSQSTEESVGGGSYDKKTLVKRTHEFTPAASGRGGNEKFITEMTSSSKSKESKYL